jgi:hypothetical protein
MRSSWLLAVAALVAAACGSSTNGADGGGGMSADQACTANAQAQCARRAACSNNYLITRTYGDMATCVARIHDSCMNSLAAPGTGNTPATTMACASFYPSISCQDYLDGNTQTGACAVQAGSLANGQSCHFAAQCQSTFCSIPFGTECGTCGAVPAVGAACNGPGGVTSCGGHGLECAGADLTATPPTAGACAAFVTTMGGSCDATHPCGAGLSCTPVLTTAASRTCQPAGAMGAMCGTNSAASPMVPGCDGNQGLTCNGMTHTCAAITVAAAGAVCGVGADGTFTNCTNSGDCMGATSMNNHGTCRAAAGDTSACNIATGPNCGAASTCVTGGGTAVAGMCTFPSAVACH